MAPRDKALDSVTIEFPTNRKKQAQGEVQKGVDALHGPKLDMLHIETRDLKELKITSDSGFGLSAAESSMFDIWYP